MQMEAKFPLIDIGALKYKERDGLEETFAFWRTPSPPNFDMKEYVKRKRPPVQQPAANVLSIDDADWGRGAGG